MRRAPFSAMFQLTAPLREPTPFTMRYTTTTLFQLTAPLREPTGSIASVAKMNTPFQLTAPLREPTTPRKRQRMG